jgi:hypothetical protein
MMRSINCIGKNSLDFARKNYYRNKNTQQICKDKNKEILSKIQESSCSGKSSIFFNSQKRNDIDIAIENTLSKPPVPTK